MQIMKLYRYFLFATLCCSAAVCQIPKCDVSEYKPANGLKAETTEAGLQVTWQGERDQHLRAIFAIKGGQPMVRELAVEKGKSAWAVLARDLSPEFEVTSGRRRISEQQMQPL